MMANTLGARVGARASAGRADFHLPSLGEVMRILLALVSLGAAAALFFGWLMISDSPGSAVSGLGREWDCTSLGRGGGHCVRRPAGEDQSDARFASGGDCTSLGRAGRVCFAHSRE
jgi:hypothetical protein